MLDLLLAYSLIVCDEHKLNHFHTNTFYRGNDTSKPITNQNGVDFMSGVLVEELKVAASVPADLKQHFWVYHINPDIFSLQLTAVARQLEIIDDDVVVNPKDLSG